MSKELIDLYGVLKQKVNLAKNAPLVAKLTAVENASDASLHLLRSLVSHIGSLHAEIEHLKKGNYGESGNRNADVSDMRCKRCPKRSHGTPRI